MTPHPTPRERQGASRRCKPTFPPLSDTQHTQPASDTSRGDARVVFKDMGRAVEMTTHRERQGASRRCKPTYPALSDTQHTQPACVTSRGDARVVFKNLGRSVEMTTPRERQGASRRLSPTSERQGASRRCKPTYPPLSDTQHTQPACDTSRGDALVVFKHLESSPAASAWPLTVRSQLSDTQHTQPACGRRGFHIFIAWHDLESLPPDREIRDHQDSDVDAGDFGTAKTGDT